MAFRGSVGGILSVSSPNKLGGLICICGGMSSSELKGSPFLFNDSSSFCTM